MKVLFVASGNSKDFAIAPFVKAQGESIRDQEVDVQYFPVTGSGLKGYWQSASALRQWLQTNPVDVIHAHYTLSGWVSVLANVKKPLVLSLMGSDAYGEYIGHRKVKLKSRYLTVLTWLIQPFVDRIICKSPNIEAYVYRKGISTVVPNGVRLEQFKIYEGGCREELGLDPDKKYVLFLGSASNKRKNIQLVQAAIDRLQRDDVELINPYPIPHDTVVKYLNSVDAFAMCSFMEGSPNVVKEAMACNCPLVVTPAGDAAWVVGDTPGCYVASYDPDDYARQLAKALDFSATQGRTPGRNRLLQLGLDAQTVAGRIKSLYRRVTG